jgi:hypothetical protein
MFFKLDKRKSEKHVIVSLIFEKVVSDLWFDTDNLFYDKFVEIKSLQKFLLENKPLTIWEFNSNGFSIPMSKAFYPHRFNVELARIPRWFLAPCPQADDTAVVPRSYDSQMPHSFFSFEIQLKAFFSLTLLDLQAISAKHTRNKRFVSILKAL